MGPQDRRSGIDDGRRADSREREGGIRTEFERRDLARHLALFYESRTAQLEIAVAFVTDALRRDRKCLYLADANEPERIAAALEAAGIDVSARTGAGEFEICDAADVYLDTGFDPDRMIDTLEATAGAALEAGYEGVSVAGENTWCFRTDEAFDRVLEFEARFDAVCPDLPVTALCQYDLERFGERSIAKALWTHRQIVYRGTICENPYYVPPSEYRDAAEPRLNARLMLEQTYELSRTREQIERREQRLRVVNRVLRHNVRNDLNAILGNLADALETGALDPATRERIAVAEQCARELVDTAEKARVVHRTAADSAVDRLRLDAVIAGAVRRVESRYPAATIERPDAEPSVTVVADSNLEEGLVELLANGVVHQSADPPTVTLGVSSPAPEFVAVDVSNPGRPIPESDQRALLEGTETPLEHGSGLGLWLVKWLVDRSGGRLEFPETDGTECRVRITLPAASGAVDPDPGAPGTDAD